MLPSITIPALRGFLISMGIFWLLGGILFLWKGYEDSFLWLNALHTPWLDIIIPHYTHLGYGFLVAGILSLALIPRNPVAVLALIISLLMVLFIMYLFKKVLFVDWDRPLPVFYGRKVIHYVTLGNEKRGSFPSGHSAVAAIIGAFWAFHFFKEKFWAGFWLGILSASICYSRVYIGVHFLGDILLGSMIGVLIWWAVERWLIPILSRKLRDQQSLLRYLLWGLVALLLLGSLVNLYVEFYR